MTSDERLREVFSGPVERTSATSSCPGDDAIWSAALGELDGRRTGEIVDHVAGCAACAESWRMASEIGDGAGIDAVAGARRFFRSRTAWTVVAVAAAITGIALIVPTMFEDSRPSGGDSYRLSSAVRLESSLDESTPYPRDDLVLRWSGAPQGALYRVEIADENLELLVRSPSLEKTEYRVPPEALESLPSGATIYWRVEALLPDSTRVSSVSFRLTLQ